MKAFQKLALVSAIAAAPFAQAELTSIDDSVLSDMTGQAGISIELSAEVSVGSVVYTDTDGQAVLGNGSDGMIELNTIQLGSNGNTAVAGALDNIKIDIDVDDTAGLIIHLGGTNTEDVLKGGAESVDFGLSVGDVSIAGSGSTAKLASGIYIGGNLGPVDVLIANTTGEISVSAFFEVTHGSMKVDVMGMDISNLKIGSSLNPFMSSAYGTELNTKVGALDYGFVTTGTASGVTVAQTDAGGPNDGTVIEGIRQAAGYTALDGMAFIGMTIATSDATHTDALGAATVQTDALAITIDSMQMDISMDVALGGSGIGNVAINDLDLSNTVLKIYGH